MNKTKEDQSPVDLYFMEARAKLIDIAAFMDRVDREGGSDDFRYVAFQKALLQLDAEKRAEGVLMELSDPTKELTPKANSKFACGAYPEE